MIYRYPFSTATTTPKIPDGTAVPTIGVQYRSTHVVTQPNNGKQLVYLFPGINSWGAVYDEHQNKQTNWFNASTTNEFIVKAPEEDTIPVNTLYHLQKSPQNHIIKWRVVSAGLRVKNTNNDSQNEGIWEAVRVPLTVNDVMVCISTGDKQGKVELHDVTTDRLRTNTNWQNDSSYQTGKIKDFGKYEFRLKPNDRRHEWVEQPGEIKFQLNVDTKEMRVGSSYIGKLDIQSDTGTDIQNQDLRNFVDLNWDALAIQISGNKGVTNCLFTTIINYELQLSSDSPLSHYASTCKYAPKQLEKMFNMYRTKELKPGSYIYKR